MGMLVFMLALSVLSNVSFSTIPARFGLDGFVVMLLRLWWWFYLAALIRAVITGFFATTCSPRFLGFAVFGLFTTLFKSM
jgi:hypothetical protein